MSIDFRIDEDWLPSGVSKSDVLSLLTSPEAPFQAWSVMRDGSLHFEDEASWLETESDELGIQAAMLYDKLRIPDSAWRMAVSYVSYEEPYESGGRVLFSIENGRMSKFEESEVVMVEAEPWFGFEIPRD